MNKLDIKDGVEEIQLDTWEEFFQLTTNHFAKASAHIYRGQANYNWPIESSLDRLQKRYPKRIDLSNRTYFNCPPFTEEQQLDAFKRAIRGRRGPNPPTLGEDDCWALAQHHGLATPLLDWLRAPFIALFFAFEEEKCFLAHDKWEAPEYRGVYILSTTAIEADHKIIKDRASVISPESDDNYRLISQSALFLRLPRGIDLKSYVEKHFQGENRLTTLTQIKIPNKDRDGCLVALNKMNINHMTLFPDIDGAAKHVNSLWQPGHEDSIAYV